VAAPATPACTSGFSDSLEENNSLKFLKELKTVCGFAALEDNNPFETPAANASKYRNSIIHKEYAKLIYKLICKINVQN
jgi:hypothetical protein